MHIYSPQLCTAHMLLCISGILNTNADVMHAQTSGMGQHNIKDGDADTKSNANAQYMYLKQQHIEIYHYDKDIHSRAT